MDFPFEEQSLELVSEYKYLRIMFKPSGSFSFAINYFSKKVSKAMFCIRKTLYSEKLNAFSHLRLFDTCVKGTCKMRNETRNEIYRNETKPSETKFTETKRNLPKRNEIDAKRNWPKRSETV